MAANAATTATSATTPEPADVMRAVDTYLRFAYDVPPATTAPAAAEPIPVSPLLPVTVRSQLAVLRNWKGDFYHSPAVASDRQEPPRRYTLRLGNRNYPHMKLAIELSPDGKRFLFRVDTHDGHCLPPPAAPEYGPFLLLMEENQKMAQAIESAWAGENLPTFKTYLREDLARRQGGAEVKG